jgi:hypothetical protein
MHWLNYLLQDLRDALDQEGITACGYNYCSQPFHQVLMVPLNVDWRPWHKSRRLFDDAIRALVTQCSRQVHRYRVQVKFEPAIYCYQVILSVSRGRL